LTVSGKIKKVSYLNNKTTIFLKTKYSNSNILCELKEGQSALVSKLSPNDFISIKGVCRGYLNDVIILNCKLTN